MILSVDKLKEQVECDGKLTDEKILFRLKSIEEIIRRYTHNNFQNRNVRFVAESSGNQLIGSHAFIRIGDTIQISQSKVNDGLFVVEEVTEDHLLIDQELFNVPFNKVTKIEYPADVVQCAIDLFEWKLNFGSKVGVKSESETLSRHSESTTYEDSSTLFYGYPVGILKGLAKHMKARC